MFYSDFIEKYDVYELRKPGDLAVRKDGYTFYNVCSAFSSVFINLADKFMSEHIPGSYILLYGSSIYRYSGEYKFMHHKCTLSTWQYPETFKWIEGQNETPFWEALLTYTNTDKLRRKITTGSYVRPDEMISIVNDLSDNEWDELKNKLIKIYPEIVYHVGQSPLSRSSAILNTAYYVENEEYFANLMKESDTDWE